VDIAIGDGTEGEPGEILVRCPMLLRAYRDGTDPRRTGSDGSGGWLATGDAGRLLADGTLAVDGRLAEVIVTGGEKVWPAGVEAALANHPKVAEVAVWRRADPEWGQRVVAWVVPAPEGAPTLDELVDLVRASIPPWAAPKELVLVTSLPRTGPGKVARRALS
jgi:O-succinylbenzoic acid--CoA ligase